MTISDLDKGLTYGDADGPETYIQMIGFEVPTFIHPRDDMKVRRQPTVMHHVPFQMRGPYKPEDLPEDIQEARQFRLAVDGYVLCNAKSESTGELCKARAQNRSPFCRGHGGALHPCDKKMSGSNIAPLPEDRVARMDRVQQFMQGIIKAEDLADDEIQGSYVRNDQGIPVKSVKLGAKFQAQITKELHSRLNDFLRSKAPNMLTTLVDIAENDLFEAADRIKAATWVAERTLGRTPEVIMHGEVGKAYEQIFDDNVVATSREDYRTQVESSRLELESGQDHLDVDVVEDGAENEPADIEDSGPDHNEGNQDDSDSASAASAATDIEERRKAVKEARDRIKKAKTRRFAARANGATSLDMAPWLIEFKAKGDGFTARLIPPDRQTPAKLAKLNPST
jgi:hypothetical protein